MSAPSLKTRFFLSVLFKKAELAGGESGTVLHKGDEDSGSILIVLRTPEGYFLFSRSFTENGETNWLRISGENPLNEAMLAPRLERTLKTDPDLWVVEFFSKNATLPFETKEDTAEQNTDFR